MANIAIVEKYPSSYEFDAIFPFEFEKFSLVENKQDKILKRDITLNLEEIKENYDFIILVGKEPCKFVADIRSVTEYQGYLVDNKYLAMLNPIAVKLNPSQKTSFDIAINNIIRIIQDGGDFKAEFNAIKIDNEEDAKKYLLKLLLNASEGTLKKLAIDTETTGFYPRDGHIIGISLSHKEGEGVYIDTFAMSDENISILQDIVKLVTAVFFNMKFDKKMLEYHYRLKFYKCKDVMLEHYTLDENDEHKLKALCIKYTNLGDYDKELEEWKTNYCSSHGIKKADFTYDLIPFEILGNYAGYDAGGTIALHKKFCPAIEKNQKLKSMYENLLLRGSDFLQKIEENGIPISKETLNKELEQINSEINDLTKQLYSYEEVKKVEEMKGVLFNVNSTKHVGALLFEVLNLPIQKLTDTGNPSCDAEVLDNLSKQHPIASIINNIKQLKKIKSTYLDKFLAGIDMDGRLRTNFNLHTTTSGRLSSSGKFNAQQLPRKNKAPKRCMEARSGYKIISQDLKTAEMYVASALSNDKNLQEVFITGVDYHGFMATHKFNINCDPNEVATLYPDKRQAAKTVSFEILYKLNYREPVLANFPKLKTWLQQQEKYLKNNGFIYSHFGRKRRVPDVFSPNKEIAKHHVRSAINFLVQSASSDINLLAGIEMQDWIEQNNYQEVMLIWGLVHDSILAEVKDEYIDIYCSKLKEITQKDRGLSIPNCPIGVDVEIGQSYGTVKRI